MEMTLLGSKHPKNQQQNTNHSHALSCFFTSHPWSSRCIAFFFFFLLLLSPPALATLKNSLNRNAMPPPCLLLTVCEQRHALKGSRWSGHIWLQVFSFSLFFFLHGFKPPHMSLRGTVSFLSVTIASPSMLYAHTLHRAPPVKSGLVDLSSKLYEKCPYLLHFPLLRPFPRSPSQCPAARLTE
ncbi:hypothetical protein V8C35DRAFT_297242 [Trichoderma chlorosporum]